jgi:hypothetical protein
MLRRPILVAVLLTSAAPALALDLPARAPGLWELEITPDLSGYDIPPNLLPQRRMTARQCVDASVDQLFWRRDLGAPMVEQKLCQANVRNTKGTVTGDLSCSLRGLDMKIHTVIGGDFNHAYTMDLTTSQGPINGVTPAPIHITIAYKHIGPCAADQRPGDFITGDGTIMHLFGDPKAADQR